MPLTPTYTVGELHIDTKTSEIFLGNNPDKRVRLPPKAMALIVALAEVQNTILSKKDEQARLWFGDTAPVFASRLVGLHIAEIRKALQDLGDTQVSARLKTVHGRGHIIYSLIPAVPEAVQEDPLLGSRHAKPLEVPYPPAEAMPAFFFPTDPSVILTTTPLDRLHRAHERVPLPSFTVAPPPVLFPMEDKVRKAQPNRPEHRGGFSPRARTCGRHALPLSKKARRKYWHKKVGSYRA